MATITMIAQSILACTTLLLLLPNDKILINASRFDIIGPVVTLTLKDPSSDNNKASSRARKEENTVLSSAADGLFSIPGLNPCITWSIQSSESNPSPLLPKLLPSLRSVSLSTQYKYQENKKFLYKVDSVLRFVTGSGGVGGVRNNIDDDENGSISDEQSSVPASVSSEIILKPSYSFKSKKASLNIKCGNESVFGTMKFSACKGKQLIEYIRGSYQTSLPFVNSISSLTFQPAFDFVRNTPSCIISGITGSIGSKAPFAAALGSSRTTAIVDLNFDDPTLSFIHCLDDRNTISPTISLNNAKIIYNWKLLLHNHQSSIITRVDPTSSIQVTWMDSTPNGNWITDFQLPLSSSSSSIDGVVNRKANKGPLVADIRVRRQFIF